MTDTEPMVQAALSQLGKPYLWGTAGPDTYDCSGLVQWAAKQAGISLTRTTYTQVFEGTPVYGPPSRGDLVFPDAGHVGIALDGTKMVHAPDAGDVVKISNYWVTPYAIRRIGTNTNPSGGAGVDPGAAAPVDPKFSNVINPLAPITSVTHALAFLGSREGWLRILEVAGGGIAVLGGLYLLTNSYLNL